MSKKSKFIIVFASAILTFGSLMHFVDRQHCGDHKQVCSSGHCPAKMDGAKLKQ
jgi:hypothetical protein